MTVSLQQFGVPGVYPEFANPPVVEAVVSGVPVFLGLAPKGDVGVTRKIRSWQEFVGHFGSTMQDAWLAPAVEGFFLNGGETCYVMRLSDITRSVLQGGLERLETVTEADLVCAPDLVRVAKNDAFAMQGMLLKHCARQGERFAILDSHPDANTDPDIVLQQRDALQGKEGYGALYFPWIKRSSAAGSNGEGFIPPCGDVAGVYARIDREIGVHRAPANEPFQEAVDIALDLPLSLQKTLYLAGGSAVNSLRAFPGRGIRLWGARTLSTQSSWSQVNVRRLFIALYRWIERNLQAVVFEPNDSRLWARIRRELNQHLGELHASGALKGATSNEAFYVKCDSETNPKDSREAGRVVTEIGLAPTVPGEFIIVRLVNTETGAVMTQG